MDCSRTSKRLSLSRHHPPLWSRSTGLPGICRHTGGATPIYSSFPAFLWADHRLARDAWSEIGIWTNNECASGDKAGLCWVPISEHPLTSRRSHAGIGHFANVTGGSTTGAPREHYDLLTSH